MPEYVFNKAAGLRSATLIKKGLWQRCFPVNFVKFSRTDFFIEHFRWLLLPAQETEVEQLESCGGAKFITTDDSFKEKRSTLASSSEYTAGFSLSEYDQLSSLSWLSLCLFTNEVSAALKNK